MSYCTTGSIIAILIWNKPSFILHSNILAQLSNVTTIISLTLPPNLLQSINRPRNFSAGDVDWVVLKAEDRYEYTNARNTHGRECVEAVGCHFIAPWISVWNTGFSSYVAPKEVRPHSTWQFIIDSCCPFLRYFKWKERRYTRGPLFSLRFI